MKRMESKKNNLGDSFADSIANFVGSWRFIILQTIILVIWMFVNLEHISSFDPYPFILMNLLLSSQAAYATPMILMSSNRQSKIDRKQAELDLKVDTETNKLIKMLSNDLKMDKQSLEEHKISIKEHQEIKKMVSELNIKLDILIKL